MKKLKLVLLLSALLVLNYGCKKDKDKDEDQNLSTGFTVKINGELWTGSVIIGIHSNSGDITQISATTQDDSEQIILHLIGSGTGTYALDDTDNSISFVIGQKMFSSLFNTVPNGEITITKYDTANGKISGTFHCVARDIDDNVYTVTEGTFNNASLTTV